MPTMLPHVGHGLPLRMFAALRLIDVLKIQLVQLWRAKKKPPPRKRYNARRLGALRGVRAGRRRVLQVKVIDPVVRETGVRMGHRPEKGEQCGLG